ncbi:MAG TPA: HAD family hydrolase [Pseudobacteroides sp.]|uniref:HAD family hydrolase n=1 Tax=Pseudobacteroides sp. TaxID=1968840 RepID=UPI002F92E68F
MIFASDLDQTLIFSEKHITDDLKDKVIPSEFKNESIITYMLSETFEKLKSLNDKLILIPTTTRTLEQYERIMIFKSSILPKFAVVNHGGSILEDGVLNHDWDKHINEKISTSCEPIEHMIDRFKSQIFHEDWVLDFRKIDNLFFYCIVQLDATPMSELTAFMTEIEAHGWHSCLHGRKLYFMPKQLNKWNAIEYIKNMLPPQHVMASGDSYMDFELLSMADYAILPSHGEICNKLNPGEKCIITNSKGLQASIEILQIVERQLNEVPK